MTCRHTGNDPACSSNKSSYYESLARTPDSEKYQIQDVRRIGAHLVLKVLYPNCSSCSYEGNKVLVYLDATEIQVLRWKKIDPHFRDPKKSSKITTEAPGPDARFPASEVGWEDAIRYAQSKEKR